MNNVGLYIHVPFCIKKCNYCDFYSFKGNESLYDGYLNHTLEGIKHWKSALDGRTVDTVYFGGGTPSVLGTERLASILDFITSNLNVSQDCETTMEVNPNSVNDLDLSLLKACGLNRISMGLQTSDDTELKLLGRSHTKADAFSSIENFKKAGIDNFSLDVMLGIPLQTIESLSKTLDFCISSDAKHISTYMLKIEENTVFYRNPDNLKFADEDTLVDFYSFTSEKLSKNGFRHYEISNFCKEDAISKHNMKYWMLDDYLGIGPSAHSLMNGERFYYPASFTEYKDHNVVFESKGKTPEEYIMLSLRTDIGFRFEKYKELFGLSASAEFLAEAKKIEKLGLLKINDEAIALTERGYLVSNTIISNLLNKGI